jgi:eukaryotic-like serine/threonine-protein kinase
VTPCGSAAWARPATHGPKLCDGQWRPSRGGRVTETASRHRPSLCFYCQQNPGRRETYDKWTNVWWAKTDDGSGNTNVFISGVYIQGGDNDIPVPGLPVC